MSTESEKISSAIKSAFQAWKSSFNGNIVPVLHFTSIGVRRLPVDNINSIKSPHGKGLANDIVIEPRELMPDFFRFIVEDGNRFIGNRANVFLALHDSEHIHIDWDFYPDNIAPYRRERAFMVELPYNASSHVYPLKSYLDYKDEIEKKYGSSTWSRDFINSNTEDGGIISNEQNSKNQGCAVLILLLSGFTYFVYKTINYLVG